MKMNGTRLSAIENGVSNGGIDAHHSTSAHLTANDGDGHPKDVGIVGAEFYFPKSYVDQKDLERFDNASPNKYTSGLGQSEMCFCQGNEDVCSMALSATAALMKNYEVNPNDIGFLAVGTETLIDRSKSVKSVLMDLFVTFGNTDIEGADEKNACFGGTQALFHAVDWIYANYELERRYAIVICVDVAIYARGSARCTGGAGAIAFLIAPDAPIVFERGLRAFHSENVYDFYKPLGGPSTEYPRVNGPDSVETYMRSLDVCYQSFLRKWHRRFGPKQMCSLQSFHATLFHSPYTRLTQKAFAWLSFIDYKRGLNKSSEFEELANFAEMTLSQIFEQERAKIRTDKDRFTDKALKASAASADKKLNPHLEFGRRIGNMYTPSLYAQLMNVFLNTAYSTELDQQRILLFSYGSGCVAAIYSLLLNFTPETANTYTALRKSAVNAHQRLSSRVKYSPEDFTKILDAREQIIRNGESYSVSEERHDLGALFPGTFYLTEIDSALRRFYKCVDG